MSRRATGEPLRELMMLIANPEPDVCIEFPGKKNGSGYGVLSVHSKPRLAHQVSLEVSGFERPTPKHEVRHSCQNRPCINPLHIKWGTRSENQQDRYRLHNDHHRGERNSKSKLTEQQVNTIKHRLDCHETVTALAQEYGVVYGTIRFIELGITWSHLKET